MSKELKNSDDESCIVTAELCKFPDCTNIDLSYLETKENELNLNNSAQIENKSTADEIHMNDQFMEINNQNQIT